MPTPRESLTSVVNGRIYVIGGERGPEAEPASAVEEYDPAMDIWRKKADMPIPKACAAISTINGKIYVIGGSKVGIPWGPDPIVQVYDPVTDKWATAADIPTARHGLSSSVVNGKIYTIGGSVTGLPFTPVPTVEEFNPSFVSVEAKNKLPSKWGEVKSQ
jgi:N-acetylneuraminic acid mutarotase